MAKPLDQLLEEARSWETEKTVELLKSRKTAWIIAAVAIVMLLIALLALAALAPLKTVQPYVIRVNESNGFVDVVSQLTDRKTNYDEVVNKYFASLYVRFREGYSRELAEEYYSYVGTFSSVNEQNKYAAWFQPKNPESPLKVYGKLKKVKTDINLISFIQPNVALVRYTKTVLNNGVPDSPPQHWSATIHFEYTGAPLKESDRLTNPLGFRVIEYRNDPDTGMEAAAK